MGIRTGHGAGKGRAHVETLPPDELPDGLPAPARPAPDRTPAGTFRAGPGTTELARLGAKAAHESRQLGQLLGLWDVPDDHPYKPYSRLAQEWRDAHMARLADTIGGGSVGPGPASIVSSSAIQMGASRWLADLGARTGDPKLMIEASRLADSSRQGLIAAHELCAKETKAKPVDPFAEMNRRIAAANKGKVGQ